MAHVEGLRAAAAPVHHGAVTPVPIPRKVDALDTTAAGDSFNAGYLAARLKGQAPTAAAVQGHRLASEVIRHRGAIIPRAAMPPPDAAR